MADQTSTIPKSWKVTTLGEVAEKIIDNRGKTPPIVNSGFELLEVNTISEDQRTPIYSKVTKFIDENIFNSWFRTGTIFENDILIPTVGTIGNVSFSKEKRGAIAQNLIAIRTNNNFAIPLFIYYYLKNPTTKNQLLNLDIGGVQPSIKVPHLLALEAYIPPLPEQRAIAAVLSSLDDKIELLREQNKTLEATSQAVFKEWFVNYRFPGVGKMIDSELGKIPEGWRVGKLGEVTNIRGGTTPSTQNQDFWNGEIAWTSPKDLSDFKEVFLLQTEKKITKEGLEQISSRLLPKGTLLLSSRAPIGYLAITNLEVAINQGYIAFLPDQYFSNYFMFLWLKLNMETVISSANGSTFLEISKTSFKNINCIVPNKDTLKKFSIITNPLFNKMLANILQIQTLSALRNTLLPKLIKGEVRAKRFND